MAEFKTVGVVIEISVPNEIEEQAAGEALFEFLVSGGDSPWPKEVFSVDDWKIER